MTKDSSEDKLLARLYYNFEGKKPKKDDWVYLAKKCKELVDICGSTSKASKKLGISKESMREVLKILDLSLNVQKLLSQKKIAFDAAWRMASIQNKKIQLVLADSIIGLKAHDARDVVRYIRNNPNMDPKKYVNRLMESKGEIHDVKLLIIPIENEDYKHLKFLSSKKKTTVSKITSDVINSWIRRNRK